MRTNREQADYFSNTKEVLKTQLTIEALQNIGRIDFVSFLKKHSYKNRPVPIELNQTTSKPCIVAFMLEFLQHTHDSVLDIICENYYIIASLTFISRKSKVIGYTYDRTLVLVYACKISNELVNILNGGRKMVIPNYK